MIQTTLACLSFLTLTLRADIGLTLATIAEVESGARGEKEQIADRRRGKDGEISRYQIMPTVWRRFAEKQLDPRNPKDSKLVAKNILESRIGDFKLKWQRPPTIQELYILWHRPTEALAAKPSRVTKIRAQSFENLFLAEQLVRNQVTKKKD